MSISYSEESKPVYKYFRGKWKELRSDEESLPRIERNEYDAKHLENKSLIELEELIFRQEKILKNKLFLSRLKDKGEKIKKKYEDLQNALKTVKEKTQQKYEANNPYHGDIDSIEWNSNINQIETEKSGSKDSRQNEEDDEENNPLLLLAQHSIDCPIRPLKQEEEDSSKMIEKELEKLNIEDFSEVKENKAELLDLTSSTNYFGQKRLYSLNLKPESTVRKETFKTHRPKTKSSIGFQSMVKTIPVEESLRLFPETNNKEQTKIYSDAEISLKSTESFGITFPSTSYLKYRDTNSPKHFLDEDEDDDLSESIYFGRSNEES